MKYDVKKWLLQASKDDLIDAAKHQCVSTGITNPDQLRRLLLDRFEWHHSHTDQEASAKYLSTCVGKLSYPANELTLGWVVTRELEHGVMVGLNENFKWQGLDALVAEAKEVIRQAREERAQTEERLGEALVEDATLAAPQVRCEATVYGRSGVSQVSHVVDMPKTMCRCHQVELPKTPGTSIQFTPVEPNPESLDDLSLEDLLGHYSTVDFRKKTQLSAAAAAESLGRFEDAMTYAVNAITESKIADMVLEHIERRFEKQGWLISRIKDR